MEWEERDVCVVVVVVVEVGEWRRRVECGVMDVVGVVGVR